MNRNNHISYGSMASTSDVDIVSPNGPESDFNHSCVEISNNIYTISQDLKTLEHCYKRLGTPKDCEELRDKIHETQMNANETITLAKGKLKMITAMSRDIDKAKKLQLERLTDSFKEVLAGYSATQKKVAEKLKSSFLVKANVEFSDAVENAEEFYQQQQQQQVIRDLTFENDIALDREARIRAIEADVIDINAIMKELSITIHEQGEAIDTIENSIDHATGHVEEGTAELVKAVGYQNRYRRRLYILVAIAAAIAIILVIILVTQVKRK